MRIFFSILASSAVFLLNIPTVLAGSSFSDAYNKAMQQNQYNRALNDYEYAVQNQPGRFQIINYNGRLYRFDTVTGQTEEIKGVSPQVQYSQDLGYVYKEFLQTLVTHYELFTFYVTVKDTEKIDQMLFWYSKELHATTREGKIQELTQYLLQDVTQQGLMPYIIQRDQQRAALMQQYNQLQTQSYR